MLLAPPFELERDVQGTPARPESRGSHAQEGHEPVACLPFRVVDEAREEAQRDVVEKEALADRAHVDPPLAALKGCEGSDRVVPVDSQVPSEVVPRPERDADERQVALERDRRDGGERAVPTGDTQGFRSGVGRPAGVLGRVVLFAEDMDVDTEATSLLGELFG